MEHVSPRKILKEEVFDFEFSICTLVTNLDEYAEMCASFVNGGFTSAICEYLYIDNSSQNTFGAYSGINRFLREAKGKHVILCHQDVLLQDHNINHLWAKIRKIEDLDPKWAIIANAGGINLKYTAMHLIQGSGNVLHEKLLPLKTETVDENFILVKNAANLTLSANLEGFHFYGTDICIIADILGYNAYVVDFKIVHKSDGNPDKVFYRLKRDLIKKYRRALRGRYIGTTITRFYISGNRLFSLVGNTRFILFIARQYYKIFRPKGNYLVK